MVDKAGMENINTTPAPAAKAGRSVQVLSVLKYLLPVASTALSIWLHNKQVAARIEQTVDIATAGLDLSK